MLGGKGLEYGVRCRVLEGGNTMGAQHAGKIEADGDHMVGGDFYTDRRTTIRVDGELDRRLAPTRATTAELLQ
ncbi:hypothetical protein D3C78_1180110 [compost metagenome]